PGSYSTVGVNGTGTDGEGKGNGNGKGGKKYPMQWLLDHTLLEAVNGVGNKDGKWEKVHGEESRWFRLGEELRYPISLEDLRMQVHVYRRDIEVESTQVEAIFIVKQADVMLEEEIECLHSSQTIKFEPSDTTVFARPGGLCEDEASNVRGVNILIRSSKAPPVL
ncbi:MAG: hypothetical protein Q9188_005227, partial [Gyalolechia gomerana]